MEKKEKNNNGITLIALVITIIILLIIAGVSILTLTGENGILGKSQKSANETNKQTATEIINLKITNAQMQCYAETQKMPDLQYLADRLCEDLDKDIEYVRLKEKEIAALGSIENLTEEDSILTKLKEYPYEFEIDGKLRLASIDGVKVADTNTETEEIKKINEKINKLETAVQLLQNDSKTTLIEETMKESAVSTISNNWATLQEISLAGHGSGKAIITYSVTSDSARASNFKSKVLINNVDGYDLAGSYVPGEASYLTANIARCINFDENTTISLLCMSDKVFKPSYSYSILLMPEQQE